MNKHDWATKFMKELTRELESRCNHGVITFRHHKMWSSYVPDYSVTVRGKTVWLEFKLWKDGKRPNFRPDQGKVIDTLWNAFYVNLVTRNGQFVGSFLTRDCQEVVSSYESLGNCVRYLSSLFDLDTTELDY